MAAQLLALPALAKALAYAKGLAGIGAKTIGPKLGAQVAGQAARSSAKKFAGNALAKAGTLVPKNVGEIGRAHV